MALTLQQIAQMNADDNYKFEAYISPKSLDIVRTALNQCKIVNTEKYLFEKNITDNLSFKKKGFYVFVIEELGIPSLNLCYLLYIGRAEKTNSFKNRFYKYRNAIDNTENAKNIIMLTNLWPNNTFVYFFEINNDKEIEDIEKIMINQLRPPFNEEYFTEETVQKTGLYELVQKQLDDEKN